MFPTPIPTQYILFRGLRIVGVNKHVIVRVPRLFAEGPGGTKERGKRISRCQKASSKELLREAWRKTFYVFSWIILHGIYFSSRPPLLGRNETFCPKFPMFHYFFFLCPNTWMTVKKTTDHRSRMQVAEAHMRLERSK